MLLDPAATLRQWAIDVELAGQVWTIPPLPASEWLLAMLAGSSAAIVPGLLTGADALDDLLLDGRVPAGECRTAARAALAAASGTTWWVATRLAHAATETIVGAELTRNGVDPTRIPLGAYLGAAHRTVRLLLDEKGWTRWEYELEKPPHGVDPGEWFDEDEAAAGFMALAAKSGAGG